MQVEFFGKFEGRIVIGGSENAVGIERLSPATSNQQIVALKEVLKILPDEFGQALRVEVSGAKRTAVPILFVLRLFVF